MEGEKREMVDHWSHEHPLTLVETCEKNYCYGCERPFSSGEQAYGCSIDGCEYSELLHEECAEMAREIRHPLHHSQHILIQQNPKDLISCDICECFIWSIGYKCTSSECGFEMHLRCAHDSEVVDATTTRDDEQMCAIIRHPSHPKHDLKLWRRRCSFKCDACGSMRGGSSYTCTNEACQYWIHERCASLPQNITREDHHHTLSLSFYVPSEYLRFDYKCDVCSISLRLKYWIYHCQLCRYIVHIHCAFNKTPRITDASASTSTGKDVIHLPTNVAEEIITPFVMRKRRGRTFIPPIIPQDDELVNVKYKFRHHQHRLTLVSFSPHHHQNQEEEEDEEDEENYGVRSELICDGCITPISSSTSKYYYMSCSKCKYNLHLPCFHLPPRLSSLPLHYHRRRDHHQLLLQSFDKHQPWECQRCSVCKYKSNGLFYACRECDFKVDIKCAAMPDIIHHAAHPQHLLKHGAHLDTGSRHLSCAAGCGDGIYLYDFYGCRSGSCDFVVHVKCAVLPASVSSRRWDKHHPLLLTYDATLNHPGDFYCDQCETQMNPKSWMYHCRACDLSFHPLCFHTTSGKYRNIKLGQEYVNDATHPHPLTFQLLTTKRRCNICCWNEHERRGFYCASCNFFICLKYCGEEMIENGDMTAVEPCLE
ncbi:hypothetical protein AAHA92_26897 [Salvia divinorum]|uniref:Zinc finger PHD-type domain-containing protein n=1 Tax=Salvia divinorum TaxID=28513 RepID=A0ABD1G317_SALDI